MRQPHQVDCDVDVGVDVVFGVYANAFRILDDGSNQCRLEFLLYSEATQQARVERSVTIRKAFLPVIRDRLTDCLREQPAVL